MQHIFKYKANRSLPETRLGRNEKIGVLVDIDIREVVLEVIEYHKISPINYHNETSFEEFIGNLDDVNLNYLYDMAYIAYYESFES
jgi:hypothetical protein